MTRYLTRTRHRIDSYADAVRLLGDHQPVAHQLNGWGGALYGYHYGTTSAVEVERAKQIALDAIASMRGANGICTGDNFDLRGVRKRPLRDEIFPEGCEPKAPVAA